jgi:hypothetical protein
MIPPPTTRTSSLGAALTARRYFRHLMAASRSADT